MLKTTRMFISSADDDRPHLEKLEEHLANLKPQGLVTIWHRSKIASGDEGAGGVDRELESAEIREDQELLTTLPPHRD